MPDKKIIDLLKDYIMLLNAEGIPVYKAYLFGSFLSDSASASSDIDVMIVSDKFDEENDALAGKAWMLTRKVNTKIEPFLIGLKKFENDESSPLVSLVKEKGIEI